MRQQLTLAGERVLDFKIRQALRIIDEARKKAGLIPLIVNFSGGKDSSCLLHLVQSVTDNYICVYMVSGIEFPESIDHVKDCCQDFKAKLLLSRPQDYVTEKYPVNDFFTRLEAFGYFPTRKVNWCSIYLKIRPQRRMLQRTYGRVNFFKLNGVRRFESSRRMRIYRQTARKGFMAPDPEHRGSTMVYPVLNWTDEDVRHYLEINDVQLRPNPLYEKYGVSGCYYCPFYQKSIYQRIIELSPSLYDRWITWEEKLGAPCISGHVWMRDLKKALKWM